MSNVQRLPNLRDLVDPLLGQPYSRFDCQDLTAYLLSQGFGIDLAHDPMVFSRDLMEVWYRDDTTQDPLELVRPWDLVLCSRTHPVAETVGIAVDTREFTHSNPDTGVCLERLRRWRPKFIQLARLRRLASWRH